MLSIEFYSIGVFTVIFISGCIVNLLKGHYIIQLTGVSILFTYAFIKLLGLAHDSSETALRNFYVLLLPVVSGISACLLSMVIGFLLFPAIRSRFKA